MFEQNRRRTLTVVSDDWPLAVVSGDRFAMENFRKVLMNLRECENFDDSERQRKRRYRFL